MRDFTVAFLMAIFAEKQKTVVTFFGQQVGGQLGIVNNQPLKINYIVCYTPHNGLWPASSYVCI